MWWVCLVYLGSSRRLRRRIVVQVVRSRLDLELGTRASVCMGPKQQGHRWGLSPGFGDLLPWLDLEPSACASLCLSLLLILNTICHYAKSVQKNNSEFSVFS